MEKRIVRATLAAWLLCSACGPRRAVGPDATIDAPARPDASQLDSATGDAPGGRDEDVSACQQDEDCAPGFCFPSPQANYCHPDCIELWEDRTFSCGHDGHCCGPGVCIFDVEGTGVCVW